MTSVTAGLKWAPDTGPSMAISTNRIAPVANVLPSRAMATFPPASCSAMMPDPITVANRKKQPTASAASGRPSPASVNPGALVRGLADVGQAELVDILDRQRQEQLDPPLQLVVG